ncbi:MAG: DUF1189 domain-containing protein [Muribaculum sp.]|nr:DUF1189 domain-containing protein [Muribaculum sp.]
MDSNGFNTMYESNQGGQPGKAPNIFKQFAYAFVPPKYNSLAKVKVGSMIGFVVLLTLIATVVSAVKFFIGFAAFQEGDFLENFPEFGLRNGKFFIDEEFVYDEGNTFIYATDEIDAFDYEDAEYISDMGYDNILLVSRERLSVMQDGEYQSARFRDLDIGDNVTIDRDWFVETIVPLFSVFAVIGYVVFYIFRVLWYFFCALLYFLIALIVAAIMQKKVSAGALYKTAVYSKVLMFVVAFALSLIPIVHISVPGIIRTIITIAFMCFAIYKLPNNV